MSLKNDELKSRLIKHAVEYVGIKVVPLHLINMVFDEHVKETKAIQEKECMTKKAEKYVSMCNIPAMDEELYRYIKKALIRAFDAGYKKAKLENAEDIGG